MSIAKNVHGESIRPILYTYHRTNLKTIINNLI